MLRWVGSSASYMLKVFELIFFFFDSWLPQPLTQNPGAPRFALKCGLFPLDGRFDPQILFVTRGVELDTPPKPRKSPEIPDLGGGPGNPRKSPPGGEFRRISGFPGNSRKNPKFGVFLPAPYRLKR